MTCLYQGLNWVWRPAATGQTDPAQSATLHDSSTARDNIVKLAKQNQKQTLPPETGFVN